MVLPYIGEQMKKILLATMMFILMASPAYAMTHKQKQEQQRRRHEHLHQLHKENKVLQKWMATSEKNCSHFHGREFHECYISSMKDLHAKSNVKLSPETEELFRNATKPPRHTSID